MARAWRARHRVSLFFARLRTLADEGILERPFAEVMSSLAQMAVIRLIKRGGKVDEARVRHALERVYEAKLVPACDSVDG